MITSITRRRVDLVEENDELDLSENDYEVSSGVDVEVPFVVVDIVFSEDDNGDFYILYNESDETLIVPIDHSVAVINHDG